MTEDSTDLFDDLFARRVVPVLVPMPAPKPYSYAVPEGMAVEPGSIVQVPLGAPAGAWRGLGRDR